MGKQRAQCATRGSIQCMHTSNAQHCASALLAVLGNWPLLGYPKCLYSSVGTNRRVLWALCAGPCGNRNHLNVWQQLTAAGG